MKRIIHTLQILSFGCATLLSETADAHCPGDWHSNACAEGHVTLSADPVPIGEEFEMIVHYDYPPNLSIEINFYKLIVGLPDPVIEHIHVPDSGTGENLVVVSQPLLADETTFNEDGCAVFYATLYYYSPVEPSLYYVENTIPTKYCLQYEASTAAETVSRVLPVFRASVEPIEPATEMPTGEVEFYVGNTKVCTGEIDEDGEASCFSLNQVISLNSHYTAKYTGDGVFGPSEDQGSFSPF